MHTHTHTHTQLIDSLWGRSMKVFDIPLFMLFGILWPHAFIQYTCYRKQHLTHFIGVPRLLKMDYQRCASFQRYFQMLGKRRDIQTLRVTGVQVGCLSWKLGCIKPAVWSIMSAVAAGSKPRAPGMQWARPRRTITRSSHSRDRGGKRVFLSEADFCFHFSTPYLW
jgi:hypothetical protein